MDKASLRLIITTAGILNCIMSATQGSTRTLVFDACLADGEVVRGEPKTDLTRSLWSIQVLEGDQYSESAATDKAVGYLGFRIGPDTPTCRASFSLPTVLFDSLLSSAFERSLPLKLTIVVRNLSATSAGVFWNVESDKFAPITEADFEIPLPKLLTSK